jgi:putative acetyltransferase
VGDVVVALDDPFAADVLLLLDEHLAEMRATSPPCSVHALEPAGLVGPTMTFFSAREDGVLLGCGALKDLGTGEGEIKSMRTTAAARGRGVGSTILRRVLDEARARGFSAVRLETGVEDHFIPARAMYTKYGFVPCGPFADYTDDPNSVYLVLELV